MYRLVEHFRWEPQHNGKSVSAFRTAIRRQEVPLNCLFLLLKNLSVTDAQRFIEANVLDAPLSNLYGCAGQKHVNQHAPGYEAVKKSIRYAAATWKSIGMCLAGVCDTLNATDGHHGEIAMISDFVSELDRRGLMA